MRGSFVLGGKVVQIADAHCDFLSYAVLGDAELFDHTDLARMQRGGVSLQVFAVWVPTGLKDCIEIAEKQADHLHRFITDSGGAVYLCKHKNDLTNSQGIGALLSIEGGESIGCSLNTILAMHGRGARMMSLTWNGENDFAHGCACDGGMKKKGYEAIDLLNALNVSLDLSHINQESFWQALHAYQHAPCASHSCAKALCDHPRNLSDAQIGALIERGGFIGINFYSAFLRGQSASIDDVLAHIEHVLELGGEDAIGFGSDFCGISETPKGLESASDFQVIPQRMMQRGYGEKLVRKICYGNFAAYILQFLI